MSADPCASARRLSAADAAETLADTQPSRGTVPGRLARVLLNAALEMPPSRLSKSEMADMTGTTWQGVTAALDVLRAEGLIGVDRNRIMIRDRDGLRALASRDWRKQ